VVNEGFMILLEAAPAQIATTRELLLKAWEPEWSINIGCVAALALYYFKVAANAWQRISFSVGIVVMMLALESPLDALGDDYLFSAHMAQHLCLILLVPPLLLLGMSRKTTLSWLSVPWFSAFERRLGNPWVAWISCIGLMTAWHLPVLYNYALENEGVHVVQHLSFLVTATMFWWPVFHPAHERRLSTGVAVLYLFAAVAENSVLGIIITFMRVGHYPAYLHPDDEYGALHLIRDGWGLSAATDQRLGGLLMWIPGCSVYFVVILWLISDWFATPDSESIPSLNTKAL
jgi:cytochrome c oxidase assembly factor CtaG